MKQKILLTGATGTVGKEVLKQLVQKDCYDVTVFSIPSNANQRFYSAFGKAFNVVYGSLAERKDIDQLNTYFDVVIHLAAIIPPLADHEPDLAMQVNALGTKWLIEKVKQTNPDLFFIYSSSVSVYGDRLLNPDIRVGDELIPSVGDEYAKTKIRAEQEVQCSGLDWTIFRLSAIMGAGNHKISGLMFHMPLETIMEIATPEDTARAFVNAIPQREFLNRKIFNLGGGEKCRIIYREFLGRMFQIYGLGSLSFPDKAFAEKNFHCGNYMDGDDLENIVRFRNDTLEEYFEMNKNSVPRIQKWITTLFKAPVKYYLLRKSEPYMAFIKGDTVLLERFF